METEHTSTGPHTLLIQLLFSDGHLHTGIKIVVIGWVSCQINHKNLFLYLCLEEDARREDTGGGTWNFQILHVQDGQVQWYSIEQLST